MSEDVAPKTIKALFASQGFCLDRNHQLPSASLVLFYYKHSDGHPPEDVHYKQTQSGSPWIQQQ